MSEAEQAQQRINMKKSQPKQTFHRPEQFHKKIVILIGKVGTGKSSVLGCLTGFADQGTPGWREGNSEIVIQHIPIGDSTNFQAEVNDANGFHGNMKKIGESYESLSTIFPSILLESIASCFACLVHPLLQLIAIF